MADSTASFELLQTVLELGTQLQEALDTGDLDTLANLVARRGELLACLQSMPRPLTPTDQWQHLAANVQEQHHTLMTQLRRMESDLSHRLSNLSRYQQARRRYADPKTPGQQILHHHVHG